MTAAEKREVIRLVEGSDLSVRRTLRELGMSRSTFYAWYARYREHGDAGLEPRQPARRRHWNRIPDRERKRVVDWRTGSVLRGKSCCPYCEDTAFACR